MKLSSAQAQVLKNMYYGWELGVSKGYRSYIRLQQGGLGRGGKVKQVLQGTWYSLYRAGLIEAGPEGKYPTEPYRLTKVGRRAVMNLLRVDCSICGVSLHPNWYIRHYKKQHPAVFHALISHSHPPPKKSGKEGKGGKVRKGQ